MGRYLCLIKGHWDEGLPRLAKGSSEGPSAALRRVAKADLTNPTRTDRRVKLADAWWKLAQTAQPREKLHLSRRARGWYHQALEEVAGLDKVAVEKRLQEIDVALALAGGEASSGGNGLIVPLGSGVTMKFQFMPREKLPTGSRTKPTTIGRPFYIGVTEVTQAQWQRVTGNNPATPAVGPRFPVSKVALDDCKRFVEKLNALSKGKYRFRIPTESEWEYACRAGTMTTYFFGNNPSQLSQYAWFKKNSDKAPHPVASLKPNPAGLYDITGNLWEWCQGGILRGGCYRKNEAQYNWETRSDFSAQTAAQSSVGLRLVCDP